MLQRNWFFWMEALQITAAERRVVLGLMSVLLVITAIRTFVPGRTIYDESYYEPVIAEFIRLSGLEEEDRRLLLARYYPPPEEKPVAARSLVGQMRSEPPNKALFALNAIALTQAAGKVNQSIADSGQEHAWPGRLSETAGEKAANRQSAGRQEDSKQSGRTGAGSRETASKKAESRDAASNKADSQEATTEGIPKVNIQQAGPEELVRLPGIGPVTAGRIIEYRENNGPFRKPEDLLNVSGIGPVTLDRIREFIIVETEPDSGIVETEPDSGRVLP